MGEKNTENKLDEAIAEARIAQEQREGSYRAQALKLYPWICGRCMREFTRENLQELTVHHRDHNHDNNPPDGSNWELLCIYCHDNEHSRYEDATVSSKTKGKVRNKPKSTHQPFADLRSLLSDKESSINKKQSN